MLKTIYNNIKSNNLEEAFEIISKHEDTLKSLSDYWSLRGDLCFKINEVNLAMECYKKSLELDPLNSIPIMRLQELDKKYSRESIETIENKISISMYGSILKKLNLPINANNITFLKNSILKYKKDFTIYLDGFFYSNEFKISSIYFEDLFLEHIKNNNLIIILSRDYINDAKYVSDIGANKFSVLVQYKSNFYITDIDKRTIEEFKLDKRNNTVVFHRLNESDSNVTSLYKNIPDNLKGKYNRILLNDIQDFNINNMAKIPLLASISVSGHELFLQYPQPSLMHNIEVGHGTMPIKACGALDKIPNFAFSPSSYKKVDTLCVSSQMDLLMWRAITEIPVDKILVSGNPKCDFLMDSNGRKNLEKLLKTKLSNKKIIFNMPTFHKHEGSGRVNGSNDIDDFIKIPNFNYEEFDKFLGKNNYICVLKIHHAEQSLSNKTSKFKGFKNIYSISNSDFKKYNLDLYEVLNAGDLLITDYSSVYSDFIFMKKPIVFTNYDIEEYRNNRGITLEPYDFWTPGPKVTTQDKLESEISKSLNDLNYYKKKRDDLNKVFFKETDSNSSSRIWSYIDKIKR